MKEKIIKNVKEMVEAIIVAIIMVYIIVSGLSLVILINVIIRSNLISVLLFTASVSLAVWIVKVISERA